MNPTYKAYDSAESLELFDGMSLKILLSTSDTNGIQAVFEDIVEPGVGPGRHIHHAQDETFIFLEGTFDVEIDGQRYRMTEGDTAFIPKGKAHAWKNVGVTMGRLRYIFSPALNIEQMFRDIHAAHQRGEMNDEFFQKFSRDYPEQETVGAPL